MALTEMEKYNLDVQIRKHLKTIEEKQTMKMDDFIALFQNDLDFQIKAVSVIASFNRVMSMKGTQRIDYNSREKTIRIVNVKRLSDNTTFTKDKNIVHLKAYKDLTYDFATKSFNMDMETFSNYHSSYICSDIFEYEWLFNYTTDLYDIYKVTQYCPKEAYTSMPSGYAKVIVEKGFSYQTLKEFYYQITFGKYAKLLLEPYGSDLSSKHNFLIFINEVPFDSLMKMAKNNFIESGYFPSISDLRNFMFLYGQLKEKGETIIVDTNRSFDRNYLMLKDVRDREKNLKLTTKLQRLNFIHKVQMGEYTIIVPQSQMDKVDEGRQQNNCVGHYYDESIIRGDNLIYFIRKTNNVNHSYITCRYSTRSQKTVEARKVNNSDIHNPSEDAIIKTIDELIRKGLADNKKGE